MLRKYQGSSACWNRSNPAVLSTRFVQFNSWWRRSAHGRRQPRSSPLPFSPDLTANESNFPPSEKRTLLRKYQSSSGRWKRSDSSIRSTRFDEFKWSGGPGCQAAVVPTGESTCCRNRSNDGAAVGHGPGDGTRWDFGSHYANDGVASSTLVKARGQTKIQSKRIITRISKKKTQQGKATLN